MLFTLQDNLRLQRLLIRQGSVPILLSQFWGVIVTTEIQQMIMPKSDPAPIFNKRAKEQVMSYKRAAVRLYLLS